MASQSSPPASATRRKKRVMIACDFCRQRKLGCDNAKPKCENCKYQGKSCTYSERAKKARPTNGQIRRLEDENAQLRLSLLKLRLRLNDSESPPEKSNSASDDAHSVEFKQSPSQLPANTDTSSDITRISDTNINANTLISSTASRAQPWLSSGDIDVQFHGPSSAIFDGLNEQNINNKPAFSAVVGPSNRLELLGACIKQRQMESINLAAGRLDFDGVDPELGMHLLSIFWNRQHASGSVVYRPAFMRDMACNGPYFSKLLLNAMYLSAAKNSTRRDFQRPGAACMPSVVISPFRQRFEEILLSLSPTSGVPIRIISDITTIQALLIMSDTLFIWCEERSLSWLYSGLAINMIVDLGIHSDKRTPAMIKARLSLEDLEIRRRLFWAAFIQDKFLSTYLGRPARLREADANANILFLDDYEELEQFNTLSYSKTEFQLGFPTRGISVFEQLCKLSIIIDRILSSIYAGNCGKKTSAQLLHTARSLHVDLEHWYSELPESIVLPENLDMSSGSSNKVELTPHALCLMSVYYTLIILLHRPFVSDGHIHSTSASVIRDAFATCAAAALRMDEILRVYAQHFCTKTVPHFMIYATYVSGTIHVRIAAQSKRGSEAHRFLQNCLNFLSEQERVCRAPLRARQVLLGLARRLDVDMSDDEFPSMATNGGETKQSEIETSAIVPSTTQTQTAEVGNETNETSSVLPDFNPNPEQSEFETIISGLDIDAIIQSFDFDQLSGGMHHPVGGAEQLDPMSNLQRSEMLEDTNNNSIDWPFPDALFGYDNLYQTNNGNEF